MVRVLSERWIGIDVFTRVTQCFKVHPAYQSGHPLTKLCWLFVPARLREALSSSRRKLVEHPIACSARDDGLGERFAWHRLFGQKCRFLLGWRNRIELLVTARLVGAHRALRCNARVEGAHRELDPIVVLTLQDPPLRSAIALMIGLAVIPPQRHNIEGKMMEHVFDIGVVREHIETLARFTVLPDTPERDFTAAGPSQSPGFEFLVEAVECFIREYGWPEALDDLLTKNRQMCDQRFAVLPANT